MASFFILGSPGPAVRALPSEQQMAGGVFGEGRGGGWGRGESTCSLVALLPVTFTSKTQEVLPSLLHPCRPCRVGTLFPTWEFLFQRLWPWGSQKELGEESRCLLSACQAPDAHRSGRRAGPRRAGPGAELRASARWAPPLCPTVSISTPASRGQHVPPLRHPFPGALPQGRGFPRTSRERSFPRQGNSVAKRC